MPFVRKDDADRRITRVQTLLSMEEDRGILLGRPCGEQSQRGVSRRPASLQCPTSYQQAISQRFLGAAAYGCRVVSALPTAGGSGFASSIRADRRTMACASERRPVRLPFRHSVRGSCASELFQCYSASKPMRRVVLCTPATSHSWSLQSLDLVHTAPTVGVSVAVAAVTAKDEELSDPTPFYGRLATVVGCVVSYHTVHSCRVQWLTEAGEWCSGCTTTAVGSSLHRAAITALRRLSQQQATSTVKRRIYICLGGSI